MSEWFVEPHVSRYRSGHSDRLTVRFPWLERFDPANRLLTGGRYLAAKRVLDMFLIIISAPVWVLTILGIAVLIKIEDKRGDAVSRCSNSEQW